MFQLDTLSDDQKQLLMALPYRVGLWVSSSDQSGGDDSDEAEMIALTTIVTGFAEDFLKSEFVQRLMEQTVQRREQWPSWAGNLDEVPAECTRAMDILSEVLDRKELSSFKLTLMEIATSVAMAYREIDDSNEMSFKLKVFGRVLADKLQAMIGGRKTRDVDELLNISAAEQAALDTLASALGVGKEKSPAVARSMIAA